MNETSTLSTDPGSRTATHAARTLVLWLAFGVVAALLLRAWMGPPAGADESSEPAVSDGGAHSGHSLASTEPADHSGHTMPVAEDPPTPDPVDPPVDPPEEPRGPPSVHATAGLHDLHNAMCPIMDAEVTDFEDGWMAYNGLKMHFCCPGCWTDFVADPVGHLEVLRDEVGVEFPEGALDPARHPAIVDLDNETSPVSGEPVGLGIVAVHRGIVTHLKDRAEIEPYLARVDAYLTTMAEAGLPVPLNRIGR